MNNANRSLSYKLAMTAILVSAVVIFQFIGGFLKIGAVSLSIVLVPIVIGAIVGGKLVGAVLGFSFGVITLINGLTGADYFTFVLLQGNPIITVLICLVKGTMAGFVSGLAFELLQAKNEFVAVIVAGIVAPVVNTGIFIGGALFLSDILLANFIARDSGMTVVYFLVVVCAGVNFLVELLINVVCAPALYRVYKIVKKR